MKTLVLILWTVCALNATAQTNIPIQGSIVKVFTNANAILLQEYESIPMRPARKVGKLIVEASGFKNTPTILVMVRNVTNAVVGQRWANNATHNGSVIYEGRLLQLWENIIVKPRAPEITGHIVAVLTNAVVVQEFTTLPSGFMLNQYGHEVVTGYTQTPSIKVEVQNVNTANAAEGDSVHYHAVREGVTNYDGHTLQLWTNQK